MPRTTTSDDGTALPGKTATATPFDTLVPGGILTLFALFSMVVVGMLYILINRHERAELHQALIRTASITSSNIANFRAYYSSELLGNLQNADIKTTHRFRDEPGTLPLPATMSIDLGDYLDRLGADVRYRMFSEKPFPWRADRTLDAFQAAAIERIREAPSQPIHQFTEIDGQEVLRYVSAVVMTESCIHCHNSRADSPFRDWAVGQVRGVQEIIIPTSQFAKDGFDKATFQHIVIFVIIAFGSAAGFILILARRNRAAFVDLRDLADAEATRAVALQETQARLEEGLGRLNAVLDNVADAIVTIDESGIIQSANPMTQEIFGHPISELIGRNVSILMPAPMAKDHPRYIGDFLRTGRSKIIGVGRELQGRRADGALFPLELSISEVRLGDRVLFTGIMRDITARKKVEHDLRASERKSRTLSLVADRTDNAVIITDANGLVEWVNDGFHRISGYALEEVKGSKPGAFLQGPKTDPVVVADIGRKISAGTPFTAEVVNYAKDGSTYWVQIDAQPIIGPDGGIEHFIAIERDVTEAKEREAELDLARKRAEEANEAKSRFLAMMSHEIRTPLNGVLGALGLLEDNAVGAEDKALIKTGQKAGDNLMSIINDILDVTKMDANAMALEPSVIEPRQVADDVLEVLSPRAREKNLKVVVELDPALPSHLVADAARLKQILLNLVGNAIKFTVEGSVTIRIASEDETEKGVAVRFEVEDTGPGISAASLPNLFEEFWRSNDTKAIEGTGLGLTICRRIVEMMEGEIQVESEEGHGSTFSFTVPMRRPSEKLFEEYAKRESAPRVVPATTAVRFDNRILVAEDSTANQMIIRTLLKRMGAHVDLVGNGQEAVEACKARPYDLILMDINMPIMDGVQATKAIRREPRLETHPPIIALTAYTMEGDRESFLDAGLDDYVSKPVRRAELISIFNKWIPKGVSQDSEKDDADLMDGANRTSQADLLDTTLLDEKLTDLGRDNVDDLITVFLDEFHIFAQRMIAALETGELETISRGAHSLKSTAEGLGARRLGQVLQKLEHSGDLESAFHLLIDVKALLHRTEEQIRRHLA